MLQFQAFVDWPSAPLTERLVRAALSALGEPSIKCSNVIPPPSESNQKLLQWATYDNMDHERTAFNRSDVLASSYTIRKAFIRKHYLAKCIEEYLAKQPAGCHRLAPRTWILEIQFADELDELWQDELWDLAKEINENETKQWWILKPGMADRGMGLRIFNTQAGLQEIFEEFEPDSDAEDEDEDTSTTAVITSQLRHFVIQV